LGGRAGGPRLRVFLRPARDHTRARDHLAVVEDEDRDLVGAAQLLHLGPVGAAAPPGPEGHPVAADDLDLVLVAGLVERPRGPPAGVAETSGGLLLPTGVEDHGAHPNE